MVRLGYDAATENYNYRKSIWMLLAPAVSLIVRKNIKRGT